MRALVVYCHPRPDSFTAAVRDVVLDRLRNVHLGQWSTWLVRAR